MIALAAYIYYLLLPPPTPNVVVTFSNPGTVVLGEPFPLTVTVSNESKSVLQNADLNIALPAGIVLVGNDPAQPQAVVTESLGTLSSGTINAPQTVMLVAVASSGAAQLPGTTQPIGAKVTYQTASTAATQFQSSASTTISIGTQSALSLSYSAPSGIFSGQNFDILVNYERYDEYIGWRTAYDAVSAGLSLCDEQHDRACGRGGKYVEPRYARAGRNGTLDITGNIVVGAGAVFADRHVGATFSGQSYPATVAPVNFMVTPSPLSLTISLNNSSTYVAGLSDNLHYALTYKNNSKVTFQTVSISASLVGSMFDLSSLGTNGYFNSRTNTVTWYAADTPASRRLHPGNQER